MAESIRQRKEEHVELAASRDVEARDGPGWREVHLLHSSLPEIDQGEIDCSSTFLGRRLRLPLIIAGMTGGSGRTAAINAVLARAAERHGLAFGVGSQRAGLQAAELADSYAIARREAPSAFLVANVGAPQLIPQDGGPPLRPEQILEAARMIEADALAVHLNFLQEAIQPEGDRRARGCTDAIARLAADLPLPVIAKETGAGMTRVVAYRLRSCGVAALDVGGRGGTSFAAVEGMRAAAREKSEQARLGEVFRDWGVPTAVSVCEAVPSGLPVIATGGIRSGLDAAKAIALGATLAGVARPLLQRALEGEVALENWLRQFEAELRTAMFLTGCRRVAELQRQRTVVVGETLQWIRQLSDGAAATGGV